MKNTILVALFMLPVVVFSQNNTDEYSNSWNSVIIDYNLKNKVYLKNEVHIRRSDFLKNWQQFILRPSVHYKLHDAVDISGGYSYIKNYSPSHNAEENNVWEQLQLSHSSGKSKFKHRFRFEQRLIDHFVQLPDADFSKNGTDYLTRFRYRFTWSMPIINVSDNKKVSIAAFDEIWLNTGSKLIPKSLNQNWFYIGLSYPVLCHGSIGLGYINAHAQAGTDHYSTHHILQATLKYHFK